MMGLTYSSQVELVKDLREKDEDFVDSALEVRHNNCSSTYKKHSVCFIVCSGSHSSDSTKWLLCVPLQEKCPLHRLQGRVESVGVKMVKVEEDVSVVSCYLSSTGLVCSIHPR